MQQPRKGREVDEEESLVATLLQRLPEPPIFPASSAWEYAIAAQDRINGVAGLEDAIKDIRGKVKVWFSV